MITLSIQIFVDHLFLLFTHILVQDTDSDCKDDKIKRQVKVHQTGHFLYYRKSQIPDLKNI